MLHIKPLLQMQTLPGKGKKILIYFSPEIEHKFQNTFARCAQVEIHLSLTAYQKIDVLASDRVHFRLMGL